MRHGWQRLIRWSRGYLPVAAASVVVGMAGGALVYYASQLTGVRLYVLAGAVAALLGAAVMRWFTRSASVSEVEVTVPQFSKVKFAVTKDHKVMARRIVVQMASRVAVRRLDDNAGLAKEALDSLYSLFQFVRNLLDEDSGTRSVPGRPKVNVLAMNMLNEHLAPFLSKWHRGYGDWRALHGDAPESDWPDEGKFRVELKGLQAALRTNAIAFATMAEEDDYLEMIGLEPEDE